MRRLLCFPNLTALCIFKRAFRSVRCSVRDKNSVHLSKQVPLLELLDEGADARFVQRRQRVNNVSHPGAFR